MNAQKQQQLQKLMQEHPELNEKLKKLFADSQTEMQEKVIELMKEYGVELTAEDFKAPSGELRDDELNAVAGGEFTPQFPCISNGTGFMGRHSKPGSHESI